ncbi:hypothetical protein LR48_Vigan349s001400 [Vigna angularis]|uniref:Uncharacterized protein n=1 Tax=Phaseolus angularis TaxID=3914 RepID=A0A0L9T8R9_PHAAN|nr:hypothetical protein LR48_Vigan349s001400 [Vigna angularis]
MAEENSQLNNLQEENGALELQSLVERVGDLPLLSPKEGGDSKEKQNTRAPITFWLAKSNTVTCYLEKLPIVSKTELGAAEHAGDTRPDHQPPLRNFFTFLYVSNTKRRGFQHLGEKTTTCTSQQRTSRYSSCTQHFTLHGLDLVEEEDSSYNIHKVTTESAILPGAQFQSHEQTRRLRGRFPHVRSPNKSQTHSLRLLQHSHHPRVGRFCLHVIQPNFYSPNSKQPAFGLDPRIRTLDGQGVRASKHSGVRPRLRIRTLDNHCVRASSLSDVRPRRCSTILQQERSSTHVNERSNIARQSISTSARQSISTSARQTDVIERSNIARQSISTSARQSISRSARQTDVIKRSNTARQSISTSARQSISMSARQSISTSARQTDVIEPFNYRSSFHFNKRSSNPYQRAFKHCSTIPWYERPSCRPFGLKGFRPFGFEDDRRSNTARQSISTSARQSISTSARQTDVIERSNTARQSISTSACQSISTSARQTDVIERSNIARHSISTSARQTHVNERSNTARHSLGSAIFVLDRSTIRLIDVRQLGMDRTAFLINVRPFGFEDARQFTATSTITSGHSTPTTFVLLGQIVRPLDLKGVRLRAFVASPNIDAKQSVVRPHPSDSKRPTLTLPDVRPTRLNGSAFRGLQRPSFFPIAVRHFQGRPYFNTNGPALDLTLVRPPDVRHLGFNRSANRFINVRQFTLEAFGHLDSLAFGQSISLTYDLKRPAFNLMDVRSPGSCSFDLSAQPSMSTSVHTSLNNSFQRALKNHSSLHVNERPNIARPSISTSVQEPFVNPCQRASKRRSTIHFNERYKTARQFMSTSVRPPLVNSHQRAFDHHFIREILLSELSWMMLTETLQTQLGPVIPRGSGCSDNVPSDLYDFHQLSLGSFRVCPYSF